MERKIETIMMGYLLDILTTKGNGVLGIRARHEDWQSYSSYTNSAREIKTILWLSFML